MAKSLDSSELFRQENYRGGIKELSLMRPSFTDAILNHVLEEAKRDGYKPVDVVIVNILQGSPERNEPAEAVLCEGTEGREGIIVKKHLSPQTEEYRFYPDGNWKYIA